MTTGKIPSTFSRRAPSSGRADDAAPTGPQRRPGRIGTGAVVGAALALGGGLVARKLISDVMHEPSRHHMSPRQHQWFGCPADHLWIRYDRDRKDTSPVPADATYKKTASMLQDYVGEEAGRYFGTKVQYLSEAERQPYLVRIENGVVFDASGSPLDTRRARSAFADGGGRAIFVMDHHGQLYLSNDHHRGKFHHTSFLAGDSVAAAGEMQIENGVIQLVSDRSGHYKPRWDQVNQIKDRLKQGGVQPDSYTIECTG